MRDVHTHTEESFAFTKSVQEMSRYTIVPKRFLVTKVSRTGRNYFSFQQGEEREFKGLLMTERFPGCGRVFFLPYSIQPSPNSETARFIEIKGYGQDGRDMCLWSHVDGDILFGMFYKNAKKEFDILEKAYSTGLRVPIPLFLGKIPREEWLVSGLRIVNYLARSEEKWDLEEALKLDTEELRGDILSRLDGVFFKIPDVLSAFSQPYNAGVVGRAVISPLRVGDPTSTYELSEENKNIAKQCGHSFFELINLGFLHLSPGTGNWTEAGELTDMADCYDLRKDRNLDGVISSREKRTEQDFWESQIGPYHTANLSGFFIEGMLGEGASIEEAAVELKTRTLQKIKTLVG